MSLENVRHYLRYAVNVLALVVAALGLPEWAPFNLPALAGVVAVLNTVLSILRRIP